MAERIKIFTGGVVTETNTFAPFPTGLESFTEIACFRRGEAVEQTSTMDTSRIFIERAKALGWEVAAGLRAFAQPAGRVPKLVYEALRDEMLQDLRDAMPVDAVLLTLHGAMVAEGYHDGEGDIIERVRDIVGSAVPIGMHLDPHAHLTERMVANSDIIKLWKEYPHTDIVERANEVFDLIEARLAGAPRAVAAIHDCGMIQLLHTTREPMRSFVDKMIELEGKDGIVAVSLAHSFPWGDVPDLGAKVLVYGKDEAARPRAEAVAAELGRELWDMREKVGVPCLDIDASLDRAVRSNVAPVIISDGSDNPGCGAPCDATYYLRRLLERGDRDWALGYLFDPGAVRIAFESGVGANVRLRVGGKLCALSGEPVDIDCTVGALKRNVRQSIGSLALDSGDAAMLDLGDGRQLVLMSVRMQTYSRNVFEELGIDLAAKQIVVVKSSQHFVDSFGPVSGEILYGAAPGVASLDFSSLPFEHADPAVWPLASRH